MSEIKPIGYAPLQDLLQYKHTELFTPEETETMRKAAPDYFVSLYSEDQVQEMLKERSASNVTGDEG